MPNDLPYFPFYVSDFDNDTCGLSSSATGVWIRVLIAMHRKRCGELSGTLDYLSKVTRCGVDELESALREFESENICDVKRTCNDPVTPEKREGNAVVTLICRRMKREAEKRAKTYDRVRKYRERQSEADKKPACNAECNAPVTLHARAYSQSHSQNHSQNIDIDEQPKQATRRFVKPSPEEVAAYCRERNNTVDPDRFWNYYESKGWTVGKSPMKDWRACVRTWEGNSSQSPPTPSPDDDYKRRVEAEARKRRERIERGLV